MLLLAGVAIQMSLGENGIIAKSVQAKKEQAKAELYEVAKMEYLNLKTKALEEGVSYQIFAASILHKYVTGNLVEENKFNLS